ncbi:MAG: 50S ribosome-binding GTPase, partial [Chloroflexi bacterium]|nr:50S ribosome-binding GTPase [Chloroflexota bacterium]
VAPAVEATPEPAAPPKRRGLAGCLAELDAATEAARPLGLDVGEAEAVRREAGERLGFSGDAAIVALVGGTGVGKSTLLNAIAGADVSTASVRRPTTASPVAWVPRASRADFDELLAWLGVEDIRLHDEAGIGPVGILDLPDLDSVAREHRERVEALLPRVDAVIWVTDPEKYRDAVLHDDFLRRWLPRLDRQLVVLNKADRLGGEAETVRRHLERSLLDDRGPGAAAGLRVVTASAGSEEVDAVRAWLAGVVDAKRVVIGRLAASVRAVLDDLAARAGVDPDSGPRAVLEPQVRRGALDRAGDEILRLIDLPGAERRAVAATRAAARPAGAGPLGRITAFFYRASGREAKVADPAIHLRRWAERGSLAPAVDILRSAVDAPVREAPAGIRSALAASADVPRLTARLRDAVDAAIAARTPMTPPASRVWPVLGFLQWIATLAIAIAAAWLILLFLIRPPVDSVELPVLGQIPIPFALLLGGLVAGFLVARALGFHAGRLGRRWARQLGSEVRAGVERAVGEEAFAALDRVDAARRSVWKASRAAREACGPGIGG